MHGVGFKNGGGARRILEIIVLIWGWRKQLIEKLSFRLANLLKSCDAYKRTEKIFDLNVFVSGSLARLIIV